MFTYEAIPRATWLWGDVVEDNYAKLIGRPFREITKLCKITKTVDNGEEKKSYEDDAGEPLGETWKCPLDVVRAGFKLIEYLGVGGMGTRGFGRMRMIGGAQ